MRDAALTRIRPRAGLQARAAVAVTFFCHGVYFASWTAHIPHVRSALGLSDSRLGLVLLAAPLGVICAMGVAAHVLPQLGSRRTVQIAVVGYCAAGVLVGAAASAPLLFAALFVWGAFQATLDSAMNTQAIAVERAQSRRLMSGLHGGWSVGAFIGAGLGAAAVGAGVSLSAQLAVMAVPIALGVGLLSRRMVPDVASDGPRAASRPLSLLRDRRILALAVIAFAGLLCEGAAGDWTAVYLRNVVHAAGGLVGLGYTSFALGMVAIRGAGNRLLGRWPAQRLLPVLAGIATAGFGGALAIKTPASTVIGCACLGVGVGLIVPSMFAAAGRLADVSVGAAVSMVAAISYSGLLLGPPIIGGLSGLSSLRTALVLVAVLTGLIAMLTARTRALSR